LCEVYVQDALLPKIDRFSFLEKSNYRIRMRRMRGVPSECLIMPLTVDGEVGQDITDLMQVDKYVRPLPASLSGITLGYFPPCVPKTDEPNFQGCGRMIERLMGQPYYTTVKADGSSCTMINYKGEFLVCSRNMNLKESDTNSYWVVARKYDVRNILPDGFALQGELVGPGIQKNMLRLSELDIRIFDVYNIKHRFYLEPEPMRKMVEDMGLPLVERVDAPDPFDLDSDGLRELAEGFYPDTRNQREGIVIRSFDIVDRVSFKVINLLYKD
jgi:RNA ligase (TIGR02306 family)